MQELCHGLSALVTLEQVHINCLNLSVLIKVSMTYAVRILTWIQLMWDDGSYFI